MTKPKARKHKSLANFTTRKSFSEQTTREIVEVEKSKTDKSEPWLFKRSLDDELLHISHDAHAEAGIAEIARFLLGADRVPKVRAVVDEGQDRGVVSKKAEGLVTLFQKMSFPKSPDLKPDLLVSAGLGSLYAAAYILAENDLKTDNVGLANGKLILFDFNLTLKTMLKHHQPDKSLRKISSRNMETIFRTPKHEPFNWNLVSDIIQNRKTVQSIQENENFRIDKWKIFLKLFLLDAYTINQLLKLHIDHAPTRSAFVKHLHTRFTKIKKAVQQSQDFQTLTQIHSKTLLAEIHQEVAAYQKIFKPDLQAILFQKLDLEHLKSVIKSSHLQARL